MEGLETPGGAIAVLRKYNISLKKKYGQNFLVDAHVLDKILESSGVTKEDFVIEIGPGIGTVTRRLCGEAGEVAAVEIDGRLIEALKETLCGCGNVTVLHQDILKTDIARLVEERGLGRPVKVVANLPYYITTPAILRVFGSGVPVECMTVMVQKEVADRMRAGPGTKDYGALSLAVQYHARAEMIAEVPPSCFLPRPKVASAVMRLSRHEVPPVQARDEGLMFRIIRASFGQRRKTLVNGLHNSPDVPLTKAEASECLRALGLSETVRGEELTLAQFAALSDLAGEMGGREVTRETGQGRQFPSPPGA